MIDLVPVTFVTTDGFGRDGRVEVDGRLLNRVRSLTITSDVDAVNTVQIELLATGGLDVSLPADVTVNITAYPGCELVVEPHTDGTTRYRVVAPGEVAPR